MPINTQGYPVAGRDLRGVIDLRGKRRGTRRTTEQEWSADYVYQVWQRKPDDEDDEEVYDFDWVRAHG